MIEKEITSISAIDVMLLDVHIPIFVVNKTDFIIGAPEEIDPRHQVLVDNVELWNCVDGDFTLRLDYDMNANSIVFDVGGYIGDWAASIYSRYNCNIYVFEPVQRLNQRIINRFCGNDKFKMYNIGLGGNTRDMPVAFIGDESSFFLESENSEIARIVDITEFMDAHEIGHIDLLKLNIEGGEYEILPRLIKSGYISRISNVQIQFHYWIENSDAQIADIRKQLAKTHVQTYSYEYVWENWQIKSKNYE